MKISRTVTGDPLPLFAFSSGAALVPCAFYTDVHFTSRSGPGTLTLRTDDAVALLKGKRSGYTTAHQHHIAVSLLAVPADPAAPVQVLDSSAHRPQILDVTAR